MDGINHKIFEVMVEEVHSGDDIMLMVNLGVEGLYKKVRARLQGVDTPNAFRSKADTEAGKIREEVRQLTLNKCYAQLVAEGRGGWLINLYVGGPALDDYYCLNEILAKRGYVYKGKIHQGLDNGDTTATS